MKMNELKTGTIFKCSWWGMADFYELIGMTEKSVKLREIRWDTCAAPEGKQESDPEHRWTHIVRDEKGNTIPEKDFNGKEKVYTKRLVSLPDGGFTFKSPNYDGAASVKVMKSDYNEMYWG